MKVLEIKNNLVKIAFSADDNLALGGFVIIEDTNSPYIAQVVNLKSEPASNYAIVKLLFTFNDDGVLKNYNGTIPSLKASVSKLPSSELLDIIPTEEPLVVGSLAQQDVNLTVDKTILENNLLICSNNLANTVTLLGNIIEQVNEKIVLIDTEAQLQSDVTIKIGKDFKLPLNHDTINYIYENDLDDVDAVSKAMIQDIFIEVQEYIHTLPERFLPFDTFINVVDAQYRETQIPQLILLKNKLLKYKELNVFADTLKDILDLSIAIDQATNISIDLSDISGNLQKEAIRYIYTVLTGMNEQIYCFVKVNNANISKRLLKRYIIRDNVFTTVICPHEFKYIEEIKEVSQNIIFFAPLTVQHDFASYNSFLNKLNNDEFVIYGAHTQNIPFITELTLADEGADEDDENETQAVAEEPEEVESEEVVAVDNDEAFEDEALDDISADNVLADDIPVADEVYGAVDNILNDDEYNADNIFGADQVYEAVDNVLADGEYEEYTQEEILVDDANIYEPVGDVLADGEYGSYEPVAEYSNEYSHDELVEQVAKDVDKVFYEKLPTEDDEFETSEDLTEDELNLIDDLSGNEEEIIGEFEEYQEELPPAVPIYPTEEDLEDDILTFEAGDRVSTAKYGEGVVEKMIKYGNKMLCSIDFPTIGRRLLDPTMTEITRL